MGEPSGGAEAMKAEHEKSIVEAVAAGLKAKETEKEKCLAAPSPPICLFNIVLSNRLYSDTLSHSPFTLIDMLKTSAFTSIITLKMAIIKFLLQLL